MRELNFQMSWLSRKEEWLNEIFSFSILIKDVLFDKMEVPYFRVTLTTRKLGGWDLTESNQWTLKIYHFSTFLKYGIKKAAWIPITARVKNGRGQQLKPINHSSTSAWEYLIFKLNRYITSGYHSGFSVVSGLSPSMSTVSMKTKVRRVKTAPTSSTITFVTFLSQRSGAKKSFAF